ncbi:MAG TPA: UvrD-helicase domain-containing protein, partial [Thermomonas sp.]|nr:UvrD-helicase domain-containing protein [Thermomonas sp.]
MSTVRDPYLELPLDGVRLVEASAGTGKTYTLATLVTRLVVERGLRIGQILAVTFTDAATQELRKRIRERLQLTLALIDAPLADAEGSEATLTRQLLQSHRERSEESDDALRHRLRQATLDIDLAAIFTIHGFCARVLREHALESGHGFDPPELLANDRDLRAELAADLWRQHAQDAATADDLGALWTNHEALAEDLRVLLREPVLLPADAPLPPDPKPALLVAGAGLADAYRQHGEAFFADLLAALDGKVLNGNSYRRDWVEALCRQWPAWCEAGDFAAPLDARIARLTTEALQAKANKGKDALVPKSPMSAEISTYLEAMQAQAEYVARRRIALLHRIRDHARARLAQLKQQHRVQTYDDLIDGVADALDGEKGDALARQLRSQYAVALVDEFQDTDARQWAIFRRVFGSVPSEGDGNLDEPASGHSPPALESARTGGSQARFLALIGDPKQAIYSFRGGDVHTYLDAGTHAVAAPPLSHNFRSRPAVLQA